MFHKTNEIYCFLNYITYVVTWTGESNGIYGSERLTHSLPGSPADRKPTFEVIGSAESLVGRVSKTFETIKK